MARAAVAVITLLGGVRRFLTLDDQSLWRDEALTVWESSMSFGDMLGKLPDAEGHPPVYPLLEWAMVQVFGDGELSVRALSALAGTVTIPVVYAAARTLASPRAGLIAAALLAASPFHLWYSQEARPYALMILFAAVSFLAFAKLTTAPERRWVAVWAVTSSLALATHYFSAFLLVPEAIWLLRTVPLRRAMAVGAGALAATGMALLPLLLDQRGDSDALWVKGAAGTLRLRGIAEDLLLGPEVHRTAAFALAVLVIAGAAVAVARSDAHERRPVLLTAGLLGAGLAIPVLLKVADLDYMLSRYVAALLVPLLVAIALALAVRPARAAGPVAAAVLCAAMLTMGVLAETDDDAQREDWRGAARALGPATAPRAVVAAPALTYTRAVAIPPPLDAYRDDLRPLPPAGAEVAEIAVVRVESPALRTARLPRIPPGFRLASRRRTGTYSVAIHRAPRPLRFRVADPRADNESRAVLQGR